MKLHKIIFITLLFILSLGGSYAQESYFCDKEGTNLYYQRTEVATGNVRYNHVMTIESIIENANNSKTIKYKSTFTKPKGTQMYGGPIHLSASINNSGDVTLDIAKSVAAVFGNILGTNKLSSHGGKTTLPSNIKPGDTLPDAYANVSAGFAKMSIKVTDRKVLRYETITTPAGIFDCIVVSEHKVEKGTLRNRETTALTWYCKDIGFVRHDTYDKNMKKETSEVLQKIENGK